LVGKLEEKGHLEDADVDAIILKCILKTWDRRTGMD
jgi:hypothetical protein